MKKKYSGQAHLWRFSAFFIVTSIFLAVLICVPANADQPGPALNFQKSDDFSGTPAEVVKGFNAALLESMKGGGKLGYSGRYKLLEPVIKDSFDVPYMARVSVGSYWNGLGETERQALLETYVQWTIATYAERYNDYSGERFEIASSSEPGEGDIATVVSKMILSNEEQFVFYYSLRKMDESWRIVDVRSAGVSQLSLTRTQFVSVIRRNGFASLVSMLREKIVHFSRTEEK